MSFGTENFKEAIKNNNIEHISWVKTNEQLADSLTNSGGGGGGGAGGGVVISPIKLTCCVKENSILLLQHIYSVFQWAQNNGLKWT